MWARINSGDVNHITDHSYGLLALFLDANKTVVTCHDLIPLEYNKQSSALGKIRFWLNILAMKKAKNIVAVSESTKKAILKYLDHKGKITVIYNGVDSTFRPLSIEKKKMIRSDLKIGQKEKLLLHVGSSYPVKNVMIILRVLLRLKDYRLIKIGALNKDDIAFIKKNGLEKRIVNFKNIDTERLNGIYNIADIFIFPSFAEGFGLPVLEAMSCGVPVICSNTSSLPEVGGTAASYFDPNDEDEILELIKEIDSHEELRKDMINNGFAQIEKFSWDKHASKLLQLYGKILRKD
jgi:glycosyltransferase involved in cell wall biosynthesis